MVIKKINGYLLIFAIALVVVACREVYTPPTTSSNGNNLVVEGLINSSADSTIITLSRTVKLNDSTILKPELGAILSVEGDGGSTYNLTELGKGKYFSVGHVLPTANKYRLRIKTGNSTYLSDYVEVKLSPPIDSLGWKADDNQLVIYANTHDPNNKTIYYKYGYVDTWEFQTPYQSFYKSVNNVVVPRNMITDDVHTCWQSSVSSHVNLASSAKLSEDVIYQAPVTTILPNSEKLSVDYSILVKQYALTKEAFAFWTNMQKNTEQLGSIFDAQPSQMQGNIHNVNSPAEVVVGYISVGTFSSQRIFIKKEQLPKSYFSPDVYACQTDSMWYSHPMTHGEVNDVANYIYTGLRIPLYPFGMAVVLGYVSTSPICADCTLRGINKKPTFWQ
ncbi:DUF4249 domain-containing protein [Mucilaginibacter agri]|uniref:DUF4249 family protein n=1 Tax=Mucilaginibacter agri TaxID=2695265 RepID=A0A965ZH67_9SPHI|nr:DUF4249 domain-containing protein [Mucilaginibacter agri]NCD70048.1 DUF4249 family protein [Mucilaginibacter agri]